MKKLLVFAVAILGFSAAVTAQVTPTGSTSTSNAYAVILAPLVITNTTPLNFGTIGASSTASTVTVPNASGTRTATGNAILYTAGSPSATGVFGITGTPSAAFSITLPSGVTNLTGPGTAMFINGTSGTSDWNPSLSVTNAALDVTGHATLNLGATLNVNANQVAGNYSGSYAVTINYN